MGYTVYVCTYNSPIVRDITAYPRDTSGVSLRMTTSRTTCKKRKMEIKFNNTIVYVTLAAITVTIILVPYLQIKGRNLITWQDTSIIFLAMDIELHAALCFLPCYMPMLANAVCDTICRVRLRGIKPLPNPMMTYCHLELPAGTKFKVISVKTRRFRSKNIS